LITENKSDSYLDPLTITTKKTTRHGKRPLKMKAIWCCTLMWTHPFLQKVSSETSNSLFKLEDRS